MLAMWEQDGLSVGELGRRLYLDSGTLSPLLGRLEASALVTRSRPGGDARRVAVHLTDAGRALQAEAERIQCALLERLDLPAEDLLLLHDLSHRLVDTLNAAPATQPAHQGDS